MSKLIATLAALLLVALVAIAEAITYTTITTTTTDEEAAINPRVCGGERTQCQQEIPMQKMSHCRMYIQSQESMRMAVNSRGMEQHFRQCCQQLRDIDRECRCDAIKMVMQQQRTGEMEEMMRKAMELPQRCGVDVPRQCDMQMQPFMF